MTKIDALDNGLRVVTHEMPHMESVSIGFWVGTGSRYETEKENGVSHFLEHILFKGSKSRTGRQISEEIEGRGGVLNAFTGEEYTCFYFKVPSIHFEKAFEILSDMFLNPAFDETEINKEKEVVYEEINMYLDQPSQHVHELFNHLLWPNQPLGQMILGTPKTLSNLSPNDIAQYKEKTYVPNQTVVAVAGKVTHAEVMNATSQWFPQNGNQPKMNFDPSHENQSKPESLFNEKKTEQFHLCVGVRGYERNHPKRYAQRLLSIALGENMSSRLFQEIREERGLAYDVNSSVSRFYDTGFFNVSAGLEKKKLKEALVVILKEMGKIKADKMGEDELGRAKEYFIGQFMLSLEKTMNNMLWVGENLLCGDEIPEREEIIKNIKSVTAEDIQEVAQELFVNEKLNMALIGPVKSKDEIVSELHF